MVILGVTLLFLLNMSTLYFVLSTWYGVKKRNKLIAYTIDKEGKIKFDLNE